MLGVGAANTRDPNGVAWKQNKDFEDVLRRLNEGVDGQTDEEKSGIERKGKGADVRETSAEERESKKQRKRTRSRQEVKETKLTKKKKSDTKEVKEGTVPTTVPDGASTAPRRA
jgi:Pin2-interacting protein X1